MCIYNTSKAALSTYLEALRNRLARHGVTVTTIKPGFVDTPMTEKFDKGLLWASPGTVGAGIYRAFHSAKNVVYLPGFWRLIMAVVRTMPESVFKRLQL